MGFPFASTSARIPFVAFGLMVLTACVPDSPPTAYLPMSIGLTRRYSFRADFSSGRELHGELVQTVERRTRLDGHDYFQSTQTTTVPGVPTPITEFHRIDGAGVYFKTADAPEWLLVPAHPQVGDRWTARTPDVQQFSVDGFEEVVIGPETYHDCLVIRMTQDSPRLKAEGMSYYAPDIGMVKAMIVRTLSDGLQIKTEMQLLPHATPNRAPESH